MVSFDPEPEQINKGGDSIFYWMSPPVVFYEILLL